MSVGFFTAITCSSKITSKKLKSLERIDEYFYLGGRKAEIISVNGNQLTYKLAQRYDPFILTALKVASYCTIIIPAIMLIAKSFIRHQYTFIKRDTKTINHPHVSQSHKIVLTHLTPPPPGIRCDLVIKFSNGTQETITLLEQDQDSIFKQVIVLAFLSKLEKFLDDPKKKITVSLQAEKEYLNDLIYRFEEAIKSDSGRVKMVSRSKYEKDFICRPLRVRSPVGKMRYLYPNGTYEDVISWILDEELALGKGFIGKRTYPDGTIEKGYFLDPYRTFSGYKIVPNEGILFENVNYYLELWTSKGPFRGVSISHLKQIKELLRDIDLIANDNHIGISVSCISVDPQTVLEHFQLASLSPDLKFTIINFPYSEILIQPKLLRVEAIGTLEKRVYSNDVIEEFSSQGNHHFGTRYLPNHTVEKGIFDQKSLSLIQGYKREDDGYIGFVNLNYDISIQPDNKTIIIKNFQSIEKLLKKILKNFDRKFISTMVGCRQSDLNELIELFNLSPIAKELEFEIFEKNIIIRCKPIHYEEIGLRTKKRIFANGLIEELTQKDRQFVGERHLPNGSVERGIFAATGLHLKGTLQKTDQIEFINPTIITSYRENEESWLHLTEENDQLLIVRHLNEQLTMAENVSIVDFLIHLLFTELEDIEELLMRDNIRPYLKPFFDKLLNDGYQGKTLFDLDGSASNELLRVIAFTKVIDLKPSTVINPKTGQNLIIHSVFLENPFLDLLHTIATLYPDDFLLNGREAVEILIKKNHRMAPTIGHAYLSSGGELSLFQELWVKAAYRKNKEDAEFMQKFNSLAKDQQQAIYDAAFQHINKSFMEPSDHPIPPQQYSINLMWINKSPIPMDQEFLLDEGNNAEERLHFFRQNFLQPISSWAKKNPLSIINVWIDSKMATAQAIENSKQAIFNELLDCSHAKIEFRDVRTIDLVKANTKIFNQKMPIYLRVDLLRAVAADHELRNRDKKYFIYADLDMKPTNAQKLFDKRTINFLDEFGFVLSKGGMRGYENGFQILNGQHPQLLESHRKVIIDLTINMVYKKREEINEQQIYDTYIAMFAHLLNTDGRFGKIRFMGKEDNFEDHFQIDNFSSFNGFEKASISNIGLGLMMPSRPVKIPPSHFPLCHKS